MITEDQIKKLKPGTKLIFFKDGGVISAKKEYVFTFANWHGRKNEVSRWWQSKEALEAGNSEHSFDIFDVELFDEKKHKSFIIVDYKRVMSDITNFINGIG